MSRLEAKRAVFGPSSDRYCQLDFDPPRKHHRCGTPFAWIAMAIPGVRIGVYAVGK